MKKFMLLLLLSLFFSVSYAQEGGLTGKESLKKVRKNAVYSEFGGVGVFWSLLNYDRIIPLTDKFAIVPRIGLTYYDQIMPLWELNVLAGGVHSFEAGLGMLIVLDGVSRDFAIRAGYRYQGPKGFMLRAAPQLHLLFDDDSRLWFALGMGYCF